MKLYIHQLIHGYRRGHQLLAGSTKLDPKSADIVARLSDLSGSLTADAEMKPYLTTYPLHGCGFYAMAKTWLDSKASRAGCVLTHTLLIPIEDWGKSHNPQGFVSLFSLPSNLEDIERYRLTLQHDDSQSTEMLKFQSPPSHQSIDFVTRYFGEGLRPLVWFGENQPDDVLWLVLRAIWPNLRMNFACCTLSFQPRILEDRPFDLLFAPSSVYSRFHKIPRANIIDTSPPQTNYLQPSGNNEELWLHEWASAIFSDHESRKAISRELNEFGSQLSEDPTAIKKLFLIKELRIRAIDSPTATIGLMDMIAVLNPDGTQACDYKEQVVEQALRIVALVSDASEALKYYFLIAERLRHTALAKISSRIILKLSSAVAAWTKEHPDIALNVGERLFGSQSEIFESAFIRGVVEGLKALSSFAPERLIVLRNFSIAAPLIIAKEPAIALGYLRWMKVQRSDRSAARADLVAWIALLYDSDSRDRIRNVMLPEIKDDEDALIIEELLKDLPEKDVCDALDTLSESTDGFSSRRIREIIFEQLSYVYPKHVREWGYETQTWSIHTADVVAASYPADMNGFRELLQGSFSDTHRNAQVVTAFIKMVAAVQLPLWLREHAKNSPDFLIPVFSLGSNIPEDVSHILQRLLNEVREIPIAKSIELASKIGEFQKSPFSRNLINMAMRSAIRSFIAGDVDWSACEMFNSTDWGKTWLKNVSKWELESLLRGGRLDDSTTWSRAWKWIALAPDELYQRSPSVLPSLIDTLASNRRWNWEPAITEFWVKSLQRASNQNLDSTHLQLCADAINFAFSHVSYPVSALIVESFWKVYVAVIESSETPHETSSLFSILDWDKGKELRKKLVDSFLKSNWPPGDLALATREKPLLRKIFKRIMRRSEGERYIAAMLKDLASRQELIDRSLYSELLGLAQKPDFSEPWD